MPSLQAALNLLPEQKVAWLRARRQLLTQLSSIWQQKRAMSSEIQVCHTSKAIAGPAGRTSALSLHTASKLHAIMVEPAISICARRRLHTEPVSCCAEVPASRSIAQCGVHSLPDRDGPDGVHAPIKHARSPVR